MSDNWIVQNLENALNTWNDKLAEIWKLVTQTPETVEEILEIPEEQTLSYRRKKYTEN